MPGKKGSSNHSLMQGIVLFAAILILVYVSLVSLSQVGNVFFPNVTPTGPAQPGHTPISCSPIERACGDHVDNDCDTRTDCADPDCSTVPACTQTPNPITLIATSSRIDGVAPFAVFFDATTTTSTWTTNPFADLEYEWSFGDPASGSWVDGTPRNEAKGAVTAHVFNAPGTYSVTLVARDRSGHTQSRNFSIQVGDPDVVFAGTNTICFSSSGTFSGCPSGAQTVTTSSFTAAQSFMGNTKRLLFRAGETFSASTSLSITQNNGILGSFGSGARPLINVTNSSAIAASNPSIQNWRIVGLNFVGNGSSASTGISTGSSFLVQNNVFQRFGFGAQNAGNPQDRVFFVDNQFTQSVQYGTYISGGAAHALPRWNALMGNTFSRVDTQHLLRAYVKHSLISHNVFDEGAANKHQLKLVGHDVEPADFIIVSDNRFTNPNAVAWMAAIGPENETSLQTLQDVIIERNTWSALVPGKVAIASHDGKRITIRNNIFNGMRSAILFAQPVPNFSTFEGWSIYNNTMSLTLPGDVAFVDTHFQNTIGARSLRVHNNVLSFPSVTSANWVRMMNVPNTPLTQVEDSYNLMYAPFYPTSSAWVTAGSPTQSFSRSDWLTQTCATAPCGQSLLSVDPLFVGTLGSYHLQPGSPAYNSGTPLDSVLSDAALRIRPIGSGIDRGAYEDG